MYGSVVEFPSLQNKRSEHLPGACSEVAYHKLIPPTIQYTYHIHSLTSPKVH